MEPINVTNDSFTLYNDPIATRNFHKINWLVHSTPFHGMMAALWNNGKKGGGINIDKETMRNATLDQKTFKRINVLFRNMELCGPTRKEFGNYRYDADHDMYHCHVSESGGAYVVMWMADEAKRVIKIVNIACHENFPFNKANDKKAAILKAQKECVESARIQKYLADERRLDKNFTNPQWL